MKIPFWICHQKPERCLKYKGKSLPLCSRCLSLYFFLIIGFVVSIILRFGSNLNKNEILLIVIVLNTPLILDSVTQFFKIRESTNTLRVITGLFSGASCGIGLHYLVNLI